MPEMTGLGGYGGAAKADTTREQQNVSGRKDLKAFIR
jgi:hypothetical protein